LGNEIEKAMILPNINQALANALNIDSETFALIDEQA